MITRLAGRNARLDGLERTVCLALCCGVAAAWMVEQIVPEPAPTRTLAPTGLPPLAAATAGAGRLLVDGIGWPRIGRALLWSALLLLIWAANGLPLDLLTVAGLVGQESTGDAIIPAVVYWPGLAMRLLALGAAVLLARRVLELPVAPASRPHATWYGYVALLLTLPYPLLRVHWALGGSLGLTEPGAAGRGWEPLLIAIPWVLAAILSVLLASPPTWIPRRLLLAAGWLATATVAMIGPAAVWVLISALTNGDEIASEGIAGWVFALFYASWFLWAIAAAAATRSYQLRSTPSSVPRAT